MLWQLTHDSPTGIHFADCRSRKCDLSLTMEAKQCYLKMSPNWNELLKMAYFSLNKGIELNLVPATLAEHIGAENSVQNACNIF